MDDDHSNHGPLIFILVLIALIPILVFSYFKIQNYLTEKNTKTLPGGSLTSVLRKVVEKDKLGKDITYYVLDTTNHSSIDLYNCNFVLTARGKDNKYFAFSQNYVLQDCKQFSSLQKNYECRVNNAIKKARFYTSSRSWSKFLASSTIILPVGSFYFDQTISSQSYYSKNMLSDLDTLKFSCQDNSKAHFTSSFTF